MSALTNPVPSPVKEPSHRPSPVTTPNLPKKPRSWIGLIVLAAVAVGAFLAWQYWLKPQAAPKAPVAAFRTVTVTVGPFERVLRVGGSTAARDFANVTAPRMQGFEARNQMELLKLIKNGTWVKRGDELAQIDPGFLTEHVDDLANTIQQAKNDIEKRQAEQAVEKENLNQTLRVAKAQFDKAKLDASAAEVRTDIERELLKLSVEESEANYKQNQASMPFSNEVHAAELKILDLTMQRHTRHRSRHVNDIKAFTIFSPMEGLAVIQSVFRRGGDQQYVQQGDQLNSGQPLVKVVNPNSMQVEGNLNQTEALDVRIGQKATIGLDAFPGIKLPGVVQSIGALAVGGRMQNYYIRNVPVKLDIKGADPRLIPDLSAYADIILEKQEKATLVPLEAIHTEKGKNYVYVKSGEGFAKREVQLGSSNNLYAVARSGLNGGEVLRVQ